MDINTENDYQKMYINKRCEYFKKYFCSNSLEDGLYEIVKSGITTMLQTHIKLNIICECIEIVKDNETSKYMSLEEVNDIYNGIKSMCNETEKIINNVAEGLKL